MTLALVVVATDSLSVQAKLIVHALRQMSGLSNSQSNLKNYSGKYFIQLSPNC